MPLQAADFFGNLPASPLDPTGTDSRTISDDQHREIIASMANQAPNWTGAITATHEDINTLIGLAANGTKPMPGVGAQTVLFFYNVNTPPPGWTLLAPDANIRQLVIGDAVNGGTIGGTTNPVDTTHPLNVTLTSASVGITGSVTGTVLDVTQLPSHSHPGFNPRSCGTSNTTGWSVASCAGGAIRDDPTQRTGITGSDQPHDHDSGTLAGTVSNSNSTGTLQITPRYASGILGTLDA